MGSRYLLDTCIWRDFYENRFSRTGRALGDHAAELFLKILRDKDVVVFTDVTLRELNNDYDEKKIQDMLGVLFVAGLLEKVEISGEEYSEAKKIGLERNLPKGDALTAVVARDNDAIVVSQDRHFQSLTDISEFQRPEELI
jgi:predicted nucleic acid-binding protein